MNKTLAVLSEVAAERARQDGKWGPRQDPDGTGPNTWLGQPRRAAPARDAARERCDRAFISGEVTHAHVLIEEVYEALAESDPAALRSELIQVAAVCVKWIEQIDNRCT